VAILSGRGVRDFDESTGTRVRGAEVSA
jgi:hypothetical protein